MNQIREAGSYRIFSVFNYLFLALFGLSAVYPFYYILVYSLNDGIDSVRGHLYLWPRIFTLDNFAKVLTDDRIGNALLISVFRVIFGVSLAIITDAFVAYALMDRRLPGRSKIIFYFFITTMISGGMIPTYILYRNLGLTKSLLIYILPGMYSFFNFIIFRTFFDGIPYSLKESAYMDGANDWKTFWKIYFPLSMPVFATLSLFSGVSHWNDWATGAFFVSNRKLIPGATLLREIIANFEYSSRYQAEMEQIIEKQSAGATSESIKMAFIMVLTLPILMVYPFLQRYFVKGVLIGSIKG